MAEEMKHILLSSIGTGSPNETCYLLDRQQVSSTFSPFGLWQLLPEDRRPSEIWFLLTPLAKKDAWHHIEGKAKNLDVKIQHILLQDGVANDTQSFLETVSTQIPVGCQLTLDVTQGLRHHAFLFYALALYLSEFHDIQIEGAWYCRWEISGTEKPFIDLKPVLDLAQWFHALAVFRNQGLTGPMARLIEPVVNQLRAAAKLEGNSEEAHRRASELEGYVNAFRKYEFAYSAGLPLELGKIGRTMADEILGFADSDAGRRLPLAKSLSKLIAKQAEAIAFSQSRPSKGEWKRKIRLDENELDRQANMIDCYLKLGQISLATGLMREWVISWLMCQSGITDSWLGYSARKPYEQKLGALASLEKSDSDAIGLHVTADQREFATFWHQLSDSLRNALLHHGMREESMEKEPAELAGVREYWDRLKQNTFTLSSIGGGHGRLLICPIGLTPGVLYSALVHTKPERVLVICSKESEPSIREATAQAESDAEIKSLVVRDVYRGIGEFGVLIKEVSKWLFEADDVHACLTGGTTLMGVLVSRLDKRAGHEYHRPIREFVLIDKRPIAEQRNDPWRLGEMHYLDDEIRR